MTSELKVDQKYINSVSWFVTQFVTQTLAFFAGGCFIWHNNCLWCVDSTNVSDHRYDGVKGQGQIYFKNLSYINNFSSSIVFDRGCSDLAQLLLMVCK